MPQALRVIIPPLTSQYLNLTKNSSLAVAIGYPDLVNVFAGIVAQPDRPGGRGDRDHHGGLPDSQPQHLDVHELVQPAHRAGGALSDDRRAGLSHGPRRRRRSRPAARAAQQPASACSPGCAQNLFSSPFNTLLTLGSVCGSCMRSCRRSCAGRSWMPTSIGDSREPTASAAAPAGCSSRPASASSCTASTRRSALAGQPRVPAADRRPGAAVRGALPPQDRVGGGAAVRSTRWSRSTCSTAALSACAGSRPRLWGGLFLTLVVAGVGIVASLPLGILLALGRRSDMPVVRVRLHHASSR